MSLSAARGELARLLAAAEAAAASWRGPDFGRAIGELAAFAGQLGPLAAAATPADRPAAEAMRGELLAYLRRCRGMVRLLGQGLQRLGALPPPAYGPPRRAGRAAAARLLPLVRTVG